VNKVVLTYINALVGVLRNVVTSVNGDEEVMNLMVSDNSAYSLNYTHFNNMLYL
jgi:hypothetical protein